MDARVYTCPNVLCHASSNMYISHTQVFVNWSLKYAYLDDDKNKMKPICDSVDYINYPFLKQKVV